MKHLIVTDKDHGAEFSLHVGDELVVRLEAIPGTGYSWIISGDNEGVLSQISEPIFEKSGKPALGEVEQQVFSFRALSTGVRRLQWLYRRPWEKQETGTKSFFITVVVEK
jgi:predicted secreted protein